MRIKIKGPAEERALLRAMVWSERFMREMSAGTDVDAFGSPEAKKIARWCLDCWEKHGKPIGEGIEQAVPESDAENAVLTEMVHDLTEPLPPTVNLDYWIEMAERRFRRARLRNTANAVKELISREQIEDAEKALLDYKPMARGLTVGVNPLTDAEEVYSAFEESPVPLFTLPGALGEFLNDLFVRDGFVGIMGPEKRGKSFWLQELGLRALRARCSVAFFGCGDMSLKQYIRRFLVSVAGKSDRRKYCGPMWVPELDCQKNQLGTCSLCRKRGLPKPDGDRPWLNRANSDHKTCKRCADDPDNRKEFEGAVWCWKRPAVPPLTWREALKRAKRFGTLLKKRHFRLMAYPTDALTVGMIDGQLAQWQASEGWLPDVVITDYADIMAADASVKEHRHQQNAIWKGLRGLSLKWHILVVTATQTDEDSYTREVIGLGNFSEDKRKYGHVTGMVTLNQTEEEKARRIMRIGKLVLREDDWRAGATVKVLECREMGKPVLASYK